MLKLPTPQLFLVDGYALIYRAFFAMIARPLTTSRGEDTSAAWGIANFLLRLREEYKPEYIAWVHDAGTSFRKEAFADVFEREAAKLPSVKKRKLPVIPIKGTVLQKTIGDTMKTMSPQVIAKAKKYIFGN